MSGNGRRRPGGSARQPSGSSRLLSAHSPADLTHEHSCALHPGGDDHNVHIFTPAALCLNDLPLHTLVPLDTRRLLSSFPGSWPPPKGLPVDLSCLHSSAVICSGDLFLLGNHPCPCTVLCQRVLFIYGPQRTCRPCLGWVSPVILHCFLVTISSCHCSDSVDFFFTTLHPSVMVGFEGLVDHYLSPLQLGTSLLSYCLSPGPEQYLPCRSPHPFLPISAIFPL